MKLTKEPVHEWSETIKEVLLQGINEATIRSWNPTPPYNSVLILLPEDLPNNFVASLFCQNTFLTQITLNSNPVVNNLGCKHIVGSGGEGEHESDSGFQMTERAKSEIWNFATRVVFFPDVSPSSFLRYHLFLFIPFFWNFFSYYLTFRNGFDQLRLNTIWSVNKRCLKNGASVQKLLRIKSRILLQAIFFSLMVSR